MSSIMKVFLLLAVMVCISSAQHGDTSEKCLCQRVKNKLISKSDIKDIQIYQATNYCSRVEIVVTNKSGHRYCLNPQLNAMKKLMDSILEQKPSTTARPAEVTSTPSSSSSSSSSSRAAQM